MSFLLHHTYYFGRMPLIPSAVYIGRDVLKEVTFSVKMGEMLTFKVSFAFRRRVPPLYVYLTHWIYLPR